MKKNIQKPLNHSWMLNNFKLTVLLAIVAFTWSCNTSKSDNSSEIQDKFQTYEPTWESLKRAKPASWWQNGKFGIFIHWGPYSVAGYKDKHKGYAEAITNHI